MDMRTLLIVCALLGGTNGLQAVGVTLPSLQGEATANAELIDAQDIAMAQGDRIGDLLERLDDCQQAHLACLARCGE